MSAWLKEQANDLPSLEETLQPVECKKIPVLEVDELWSFVFRGKDKVWVWIAMNRETQEIVASAYGDRTENTCEGYDDLGDFGPINERASVHGSRLDRLEEEFIL